MSQTHGGGRPDAAGKDNPDWPLLAAVAAGAVSLATLHLARRPDLTFTSDFLLHDHGNQLLIGRQLAAGASLYVDVAYPYGPLPAYLLGLLAAAGSLSAITYVITLSVLSVACIVLMAHAVRRTTTRAVAAVTVGAGLMPFTVTPGAVTGGYTNNSYIGLERLSLTALVVLWRPPWDRSHVRSAAAGTIAGASQFIKFGTGALAAAAWIAADVAAWVAAGRPAAERGRLIAGAGLVVSAALAVEALRWLLAFSVWPSELAWDVAWPAYTAAFYETIPRATRWPASIGAREFLTQYLVPIAGLAATLAALCSWRRSATTDVGAFGLLIPTGVFLAGTLGYFGHIHTVRQYAWTLIPAAALWLGSGPRWRPLVGAAVAVPAVALMVKIALLSVPDAGTGPLRMRNGDVLWLHASQQDAVARVTSAFERAVSSGPPGSVLVVPIAGGLHFYFGGQAATRHLWLLPHYVRPFERVAIAARLPDMQDLFVAGHHSEDPQQLYWTRAVQQALGEAPAGHLERRAVVVESIAPGWWHVTFARP